MTTYYSTMENLNGFQTPDLEKDPYCAANLGPDMWCRVEILAGSEEETYSVLLVDYGSETVVSADSLQPLWPQFRVLPKMTAEACLAGKD